MEFGLIELCRQLVEFLQNYFQDKNVYIYLMSLVTSKTYFCVSFKTSSKHLSANNGCQLQNQMASYDEILNGTWR